MARSSHSTPDGITDGHVRPAWQRANPFALILLAALLAVALSGLLGGGRNPTRTAEGAAARLTVTTPARLRNGMFFETRVLIEPKQPVAELVLAISPALWRDVTINSTTPEADKEVFEDGMIRLSFGKAEAGQPLRIKFDGQINPPLVGGNAGEMAVYDGKTRLVAVPVRMRVLP